eukprot:scaffold119915_cov19-Tisochrysis_lutea.AAC.1
MQATIKSGFLPMTMISEIDRGRTLVVFRLHATHNKALKEEPLQKWLLGFTCFLEHMLRKREPEPLNWSYAVLDPICDGSQVQGSSCLRATVLYFSFQRAHQ